MLPFLGTQELGKDGGSSRETRSTPDPPLPCPLTPAARQERGFCPTSPSRASFPAPSSPLQPLHAEQLPCLAGDTWPSERGASLPSPPWQSSVRVRSPCTQGFEQCHPFGAAIPPLSWPRGRAGQDGNPAPSPPVWVWISQRGAGWLTVRFKGCTEFAVQPVLRSQLRWNRSPALLCAHPEPAPVPSHPSRPLLSSSRSAECGAVAGSLRVTEESRKTGAGFSSAAPCPRGAGGARRCSGSGWDQPRAGARAPGCSPEPGRAAGRDGQGGWRGTEQSKDAN